MIRVLLVDDQSTIRRALKLSLASQSEIEIVGDATDGKTAIEVIKKLDPDVALVDIEMPGMDGLTTTKIINQNFSRTKVLILSNHDKQHYIHSALEAGAKGYLLKTTSVLELVNAIHSVNKGYVQLGPGLFEKYMGSANDENGRQTQQQAVAVLPKTIASATITSPPPVVVASAPAPTLDWSNVTQEAIDTLPQVWTRGLLYLLVFFSGIAIPWAMFSRIDVTSTARGRLEPKGKTIKLDTEIAGVVGKIQVKEGQQLKAGQNIIELKPNVIRADLQQAQAKLKGLFERLQQLQLLEKQLNLTASTQRSRNQAEIAEQIEFIKQTQQKIVFNRTQIEAANNFLSKDRNIVKRYRFLRQEGVISGSQLDEAERQYLQNSQNLKQAQSELVQNQIELQKQQSNRDKVLRQGDLALIEADKQIRELQSQTVDVRSHIAQTKNQIKSLQYQWQQHKLIMPTDGTIFQLSVLHPGTVVQSGQTIAQVAPKGTPLVLRATVSGKDSGLLSVGKPVKIKFDAYPFQDYEIIPGRISWMAPDSKTPSSEAENASSDRPEVFEIEITLDRNYIKSADNRILLTPGQSATAEIIVRQRRLVDFVLEPFQKLQKGGLEL
jgi:HlyD family secretion protein